MWSLAQAARVNLSKGVVLVLVGTLLVLSALLLLPFLQYVLGAVMLAYVLYPLQVRLETYVSPMGAAIALVSLAVAVVVVPLVVVLATVVDSAERLLQDYDTESIPFEAIEARIAELTGYQVDIAAELAELGRELGTVLFERSIQAVGAITFHLIGLALALFLVYYLLKDGEEFVDWLHSSVPLHSDLQRELYAEVDAVMWGVLVGHVFVAIVQGIVAGVGLVATGVPNPLFWTAVMIVLAMVPIVGAIPVWGGAVVYLFLSDEPVFALGLFLYSVVVVGLTDDYLRPLVVDRYASLNPAVILLGILGGAYAFGIMGLFFGPVVLGALKAAIEVGLGNWADLGEEESG